MSHDCTFCTVRRGDHPPIHEAACPTRICGDCGRPFSVDCTDCTIVKLDGMAPADIKAIFANDPTLSIDPKP